MRDPIRWFKCKLKPPKNVQPDSVFSSREGMIIHPSNSDDDDNDDESSLHSEATASTSGSGIDGKKKASKKKTKSNCL